MVSLAEKRQKIRYLINNKTEWSDDKTKYGQRLMEKMGWKEGAGLGKHETGRVEHVDLKMKQNVKGLGFLHGKYDQEWLGHQTGFDSMLKQLQESHSSTSNGTTSNLSEQISQTKTRFSYKKLSSGKDLSSRSHHDLDCVFGWNTIKQLKQEKEEELAQDEANDAGGHHQHVTSKQSINDYFKQKSLVKQSQLSGKCEQQTEDVANEDEEQLPRRKKRDKTDDQTTTTITTETDKEVTVDELDNKKKKKKKRHHSESTVEPPASSIVLTTPSSSLCNQNDVDLTQIFPGSNLPDIVGYRGFQINQSWEQIIRTKQKKRRQKKLHHKY